MNIDDAKKYTISIKKTECDGEEIYLARIAEFPHVREYADSESEVYELAIETIVQLAGMYAEQEREFPQPIDEDRNAEKCSGRFTLRMPKSLHRNLNTQAKDEGVSLNAHICAILSGEVGKMSLYSDMDAYLKTITFRILDADPFDAYVFEESNTFCTHTQYGMWSTGAHIQNNQLDTAVFYDMTELKRARN